MLLHQIGLKRFIPCQSNCIYIKSCEIHVALTFQVPGLMPDMLESRTTAHQAEVLVTWHACHYISSSVQPAMQKKQ